jgi:hypothetical protein
MEFPGEFPRNLMIAAVPLSVNLSVCVALNAKALIQSKTVGGKFIVTGNETQRSDNDQLK